jgi:hypothetical protein
MLPSCCLTSLSQELSDPGADAPNGKKEKYGVVRRLAVTTNESVSVHPVGKPPALYLRPVMKKVCSPAPGDYFK